jgi:hypothetical protein
MAGVTRDGIPRLIHNKSAARLKITRRVAMRKFLIIIPFLTACITQKVVMTRESFIEVEMGDSIAQIEKKCGRPYKIYTEGTATDIYEYLENVYMNATVIQTRRYMLQISKGKVVGKYVRYMNTPAVYDGMFPETPYPNF